MSSSNIFRYQSTQSHTLSLLQRQLTLVDVALILHVSVLLGVAGTAHPDGLACLDGRAMSVIARDLRPVHLTLLPQTPFLVERSHDHSEKSCDYHMQSHVSTDCIYLEFAVWLYITCIKSKN